MAADDELEPAVEVARVIAVGGKEVQVLSAGDVARLLGVTRQRVYQLMDEHDEFPRPVAQLARGIVWERRAIERWAQRWPRRPGPAPKASRRRSSGART